MDIYFAEVFCTYYLSTRKVEGIFLYCSVLSFCLLDGPLKL